MMRSLLPLLFLAGAALAGAGLAGAAVAGVGIAPPNTPLSVELPTDSSLYPVLGLGDPSPDPVNANCLACHSPAMVLTQPRLTRAEWAAEVAKMRNVYKAPIDPADDDAIIAWLVAAQQPRLPMRPHRHPRPQPRP